MCYATLHADGPNTETPFFAPTGPCFRAFHGNGLPFAARLRDARQAHRPVLLPACPHRMLGYGIAKHELLLILLVNIKLIIT